MNPPKQIHTNCISRANHMEDVAMMAKYHWVVIFPEPYVKEEPETYKMRNTTSKTLVVRSYYFFLHVKVTLFLVCLPNLDIEGVQLKT